MGWLELFCCITKKGKDSENGGVWRLMKTATRCPNHAYSIGAKPDLESRLPDSR